MMKAYKLYFMDSQGKQVNSFIKAEHIGMAIASNGLDIHKIVAVKEMKLVGLLE